MSENKRYYWIKLKTDFFNMAEIDFLLSQPDGCQYVVLYEMLCLLTANNDGELSTKIGDVIIPYDVDKIEREAKYFSRDTIMVALELYKKLGLIYILSENNNIFKISNFDKMVGSESQWAEKKRLQREKEKQKLLSEGQKEDNVQDNVRQEYRDKSIDNRDKDIDIYNSNIDKDRGMGEGEDKNTKIPYKDFVGVYNATHIHQVKKITPKRKTAILKFTKDYNLGDFKKVCTISQQSEFLSGKNKSNWIAGFDWLIKTDNATKVLEGQYGGLTEEVKESIYDKARKRLEEEENRFEGGKVNDSY